MHKGVGTSPSPWHTVGAFWPLCSTLTEPRQHDSVSTLHIPARDAIHDASLNMWQGGCYATLMHIAIGRDGKSDTRGGLATGSRQGAATSPDISSRRQTRQRTCALDGQRQVGGTGELGTLGRGRQARHD